VGSFAGAENGPQFGPLVVGQWWGLGNEAVDVHGQVVRVYARGPGSRVGLRTVVLLVGYSAGRGQGGWSPSDGCLTCAGCVGRAVSGVCRVCCGGGLPPWLGMWARHGGEELPGSFPSQWLRSAGVCLARVTGGSWVWRIVGRESVRGALTGVFGVSTGGMARGRRFPEVLLLLVSWGKMIGGSGGETSPTVRCFPV
jgi:hypothetical protein